jgi:hypothetical protein
MGLLFSSNSDRCLLKPRWQLPIRPLLRQTQPIKHVIPAAAKVVVSKRVHQDPARSVRIQLYGKRPILGRMTRPWCEDLVAADLATETGCKMAQLQLSDCLDAVAIRMIHELTVRLFAPLLGSHPGTGRLFSRSSKSDVFRKRAQLDADPARGKAHDL